MWYTSKERERSMIISEFFVCLVWGGGFAEFAWEDARDAIC